MAVFWVLTLLIYPTKTRSELVGQASSLKRKIIGCPFYRAQVDGATESVLIRHEKTSRPSQARDCWNQSQVGVNPKPVARVQLYHSAAF